jgi:hypothetical protein
MLADPEQEDDMSNETAKPTDRDHELSLKDLDAVNGGAVVDFFHPQMLPPGPCCKGTHYLNPQPLPPG